MLTLFPYILVFFVHVSREPVLIPSVRVLLDLCTIKIVVLSSWIRVKVLVTIARLESLGLVVISCQGVWSDAHWLEIWLPSLRPHLVQIGIVHIVNAQSLNCRGALRSKRFFAHRLVRAQISFKFLVFFLDAQENYEDYNEK